MKLIMENWKSFLTEADFDTALRKSDPKLPAIFKLWRTAPAAEARAARDALAKELGNARYGRMLTWLRDDPSRPMTGVDDRQGHYVKFLNFMKQDGRK